MGYELRRWLADRLPAGLSSGERLVALEIADQANEQTRCAYGRKTVDAIIRRTGYADDKQLGKVLGKLGARGIELRVPVRDQDGSGVMDKRGRPLFACNGHAIEFYVPTAEECSALKLPQLEDLEAAPHGGASPAEAPPPGPEAPPPGPEAPPPGPEAPPSGGPISSISSASPQYSSSLSQAPPAAAPSGDEREKIPSDPLEELTLRLMDEHDATWDEARSVLDDVRDEGRIRSLEAWAASEIGRKDLAMRIVQERRLRAKLRAELAAFETLPPASATVDGSARTTTDGPTPALTASRT